MSKSHHLKIHEAQRQRLESLLLRFDQSWNPGLLEDYVARLSCNESHLQVLAVMELVKIDLERWWRAGRERRVEEYFQEFPQLATSDSLAAELMFAEFQVRRGCGQTVELEEYQRRFPRQFEELRQIAEQAAVTQDTSRVGEKADTLARRPAETNTLPEEFGRYRILRQLGAGAMGSVYLAHDTQLDRDVALKTPTFSGAEAKELIGRFYEEARSAATLRHPNICPVYDVGEIDGIHFISMAYIEGRPLSDYIRLDRPIPQRAVVSVLRKLALGLEHAHRQGVIHRDLKPSNLMIDRRREPIVMDFGLARREENQNKARITQSGMLLGTPAYMSPEQVEGKVEEIGAASDIYSLGVVFYEMLTGQLPFQGSVGVIIHQILSQPPAKPSELRPALDPRLETICLKMMSKRIADRYSNMQQVAQELTEFLKQTKDLEDSSQPEALASSFFADATLHKKSPVPSADRPQGDSRSSRSSPVSPMKASVAKQPPTQPVPVGSSSVRRLRHWPPRARWLAGLGVVMSLLALLAVVILFRTPWGDLRIEVNDAHLEVLVDGRKITLKDNRWEGGSKARQHTLAIKIGEQKLKLSGPTVFEVDGQQKEHRLSVKVNGVKLSSNKFSVVRGETTVVKIELQHHDLAVVDAPPTPLPDGPPQAMHVLEGARCIAFSPDGRRLLSALGRRGQTNSMVTLWDVQTGKVIHRLSGHSDRITSVGFSPDGKQGLSSGFDGTARLWDLEAGGLIHTLRMSRKGWYCYARFMADGTRGVVMHMAREIEVFDLASGRRLRRVRDKVFRYPGKFRGIPYLSPGAQWALVSPEETRTLDLWTVGNVHRVRQIAFDEVPTSRVANYTFSPDAKRALTIFDDGSVVLWSVATGSLLQRTKIDVPSVESLALSPGGKTFVTGGGAALPKFRSKPFDSSVRVWSISTGKEIHRFKGHKSAVRGLAISPDGRFTAAASVDGARIWRLPR